MKIPNFLICEFDVGMHNDQQTSKLSWGLQGPTERSLIPEHVPGRIPYYGWITFSLLIQGRNEEGKKEPLFLENFQVLSIDFSIIVRYILCRWLSVQVGQGCAQIRSILKLELIIIM